MTQQTDQYELLDALLGTMESGIIPATEAGVATGNKIFGAALMKKSDLPSFSSRPTTKRKTRSGTVKSTH